MSPLIKSFTADMQITSAYRSGTPSTTAINLVPQGPDSFAFDADPRDNKLIDRMHKSPAFDRDTSLRPGVSCQMSLGPHMSSRLVESGTPLLSARPIRKRLSTSRRPRQHWCFYKQPPSSSSRLSGPRRHSELPASRRISLDGAVNQTDGRQHGPR